MQMFLHSLSFSKCLGFVVFQETISHAKNHKFSYQQDLEFLTHNVVYRYVYRRRLLVALSIDSKYSKQYVRVLFY